MKNRFIIIDGNSLLNRAFYAMKNPMITKEGIYTQGIYGFINMMNKSIAEYKPEYIAVTFDKKAPTFRHKEYSDYKAGRKKMPEELAVQIPYLKEILKAMNIIIYEMDGFEADDLIGTLAKKAEEKDLLPLIITGDRDALQLASDKTEVLITKKGISIFELFDEKKFTNTYGYTPKEYIDVKGLMGDKSDNIPGIPGIGEKTAQKLIIEYKSIENLIDNIEKLPKNKIKERITDYQNQAILSKMLATIDTSVPLKMDYSDIKYLEPDWDKLRDLYLKLEFNSFLKNIKGTEKEVDEIKNNIKNKEQKIINDIDEFEKYLKTLNEGEDIIIKIFSDNNHISKSIIYGIGIMSSKLISFVNCENNYDCLLSLGKTMTSKKLKIHGHFLVEDYYLIIKSLVTNDLDIYKDKENLFETEFDSAISQYVLTPNENNYSIDILSMQILQKTILSIKKFIKENSQISFIENNDEKFLEYFIDFAIVLDNIKIINSKKIIDEKLDEVYKNIELPLIEVLASMEMNGIKVDKIQLDEIGKGLKTRIEELKANIYEEAEEEFNINSTQQLGNILFEKLSLPVVKKNKTGYSTSIEVLEKLKYKHSIIEKIIEYRGLSKINSTYVDGLIPLIDNEGKIHAHFQQTGTSTGRLSCTEPNLQNIPIRYEEGRNLRKVFVSDEKKLLVGADYSQIELRVLADMSEEENLIEAFNSDKDIHTITASKVFKIKENEVTPLQRSRAKAVNFGVIYGMSGFGLSTELNITRKEAENYINEYFINNPSVKKFMDEQIEFAKKEGFVKTIMGRKRYIREINSPNYMTRQSGERLAMNTPIQGSAADIIKIAMIKVYRSINKNKLKSRLILQIHDELIIETLNEEQDEVEKILTESMTNAVNLKINLTIDLNKSKTWYNLK